MKKGNYSSDWAIGKDIVFLPPENDRYGRPQHTRYRTHTQRFSKQVRDTTTEWFSGGVDRDDCL